MSAKQLLITGGTGFLGKALVQNWLQRGWQVTMLSRQPERVHRLFGDQVRAVRDFKQLPTDSYYDAVINLAGEPIFANRWTEKRKQCLMDSRIKLTASLLDYLARLTVRPPVLISASAIGIYGDRADPMCDEIRIAYQKSSFSQHLCFDWETEARKAEQLNMRVCLIRTGLVLAKHGGILEKMLPAFRLGLGGVLGDGRQWMSWIHLQDWLSIIDYLLTHTELRGAFNATAPNPVTNQTFTQMLAQHMQRPSFCTIPTILLQWVLGEMSECVLGSQYVLPERLLASGFMFKFNTLDAALSDIC